jgi:hypothetical protein
MLSKNTEIYGILAKKHGLHRSVVQMACNHPFMFASRRISDPDDERTLMFAYLFKIKLKKRFISKKRELYDAAKSRKDNKESCTESV